VLGHGLGGGFAVDDPQTTVLFGARIPGHEVKFTAGAKWVWEALTTTPSGGTPPRYGRA
jgi:hypothetical protein